MPLGHRMSRLSRPICSLGTQLGGMPGTPVSRGAASSCSLLAILASDSPPYTLPIRAGGAAKYKSQLEGMQDESM